MAQDLFNSLLQDGLQLAECQQLERVDWSAIERQTLQAHAFLHSTTETPSEAEARVANTVNENLVQILSLCSFAINIHRNVPLAATTATSTPEPELKACLSQELPVAEPIGAEQSKRIAAIEDTMVLGSNSPGFSAIIGHADAKQILREAVVWPVSMPHLFQGARRSWNSLLMFGPPGTGKSALARAVAAEIQGKFYCVSSSDLVSSWVGESEKLIRELFRHARAQTEQCVIFFDEVDSLCRQRQASEDDSARRIKTELLRQIEGADANRTQSVFVLCATNCPWELDSAFLRRFQKKIFVGLPTEHDRQTLITRLLGEVPHSLTEADLNLIAEKTQGHSGSDLRNLTMDAIMEPVRELAQAGLTTSEPAARDMLMDTDNDAGVAMVQHKSPSPHPRPVLPQDFKKALEEAGPSVASEDMARFHAYKLRR